MLGEKPYIHPASHIYDSHLGIWTGPNSSIVQSSVAYYTYTAGDNQIIYADIGKFCSIASHVRINPGNHSMERATQLHMTYRRHEYGFGNDDRGFFAWREAHRGVIVRPGAKSRNWGSTRFGRDRDQRCSTLPDRRWGASQTNSPPFSPSDQ